MEIPISIVTAFLLTYYSINKSIAAWQVWHETTRVYNKNAWMRNECLNPTFFANMQIHSDVCEKVQKQAITTPIMHALQTFLKFDDLQIISIVLLILCILGRCLLHIPVYKRNFILLPK